MNEKLMGHLRGFENNYPYTPLHWAALNGFESVIQLLISKGIERNSRSNFGWTALMQAVTNGHTAVVRALLDAGDDPKMATDDG